MKTSFKKIVAGASVIALVFINSAFADLTLTGSTGTGLTLTGAVGGENYSGSTVSGTLTLDVSAQVLPTLSFEISTGSIALETLDASKVSTGSMDIKLSTNAANGASVSVSSDKLGLTSTTGDVIEYTGSVTQGVEGYNLTVFGNTAEKGTTPTITVPTVSSKDSTEIMNVDNPTDKATVTVQSNASIDSITPSGSYSITHVFTVTGSF